MGHQSSKYNKNQADKPSKLPSSFGNMSIQTNRQYNLSEFAVITVIFNPVKYRSRYEHYQRFAAHMTQTNVQLYTVECIFESTEKFGLPKQDFEVTNSRNANHIQVRAPSIMWMKENLINIALTRLPQHINYVAWIDGDIEFERSDWAQLTINELQRYPIVQLFELSFFLGPGGKKDILRRDYSFGYSIRHNKPIDPKHYDTWYAHPGYAWAMRRSALNQIGGLPDFCIIGSGDLHFAFALLNRIEETLRPNLHPDYKNIAITWGNRVAQLAQNGTNVSYIPTNIYHYWHGNRNDRNYVDRWMIIEKHQFSPLNNLEKNDDSGVLRLARRKSHGSCDPDALERDIVAYFKSRNEDTNVKINQPPQQPNKAKPFVAGKTQPNRPVRGITSGGFRASGGHAIWSSGPHGTHVDDHDPYWDQCCCPGHHHSPHNHDCPCSPNHCDDQQCWDPSENDCHNDQDHNDHHHHHDHDHDDHHHDDHDHDDHHHYHDHDDHHHHHHENPDTCYPYDDNSAGHHSSYDHGCHEDHGNTDNSGYNNDYSAGTGGYDHTDYSGPGSFY